MITPRTALPPILIVEDGLDDAYIVSRLVSKCGCRNPLQFARNAEEAIVRLSKVAPSSDFLPPLAVFTDLEMPGSDGFMLLQWLRTQTVHRIFTAMISTSDFGRDVRKAFDLGCHAYVRKYPSMEQMRQLCAAAEAFAADGTKLPVPGLAPSPAHF